ncbi:carboxypeptidase-like regulatory domain-containing protein [Dysgonomonas sp. Marseille-P4677]|uniref:TonB-dependent receptor n=1 Tax=Dysgonomonas sp. Marseille-P4677 TaxID=2364790 RepID=UPI001911677D|nr:carboxypeptidase-like regulatory domain-containing protein [Dysgonomonas sp. Marseille-P4677]MBK5722498.1 carboxypeptidase-like regulatory domain-containing protein [Dysgonomonas sp. Marseille-P4677]
MIKKNFLFLLLLISISTYAQKVKIAGVVTDSKHYPISFVSVVQANSLNGVYTNNQGFYELQAASKDSIKIIFSSVGYKKHIYILPDLSEDVILDVVLQEEDKVLNTVVIEGQRTVTTVIERVDYLATKRASNPWRSIEALLATMGGVSSTNELSSQYSVRGGNFDENIVYVNGIEIYRPFLVRSAQQEGLSFINPNMVQTVGFSAGGYSAEYGDKMSSVLDITYKKPKRFEGAASASLLGGDIYIGSSTDRFSQVTGFRYKTLRSLLGTSDTKAEYDPSFLDFQTYITYSLSSGWNASFLGNYSQNTYKFTPTTRETSFGTLMTPRTFKVYFDGWENDKFLTYQAALTINGKLNDNFNIGFTASAFSSDEQERYDIEGSYLLKETDLTGEGYENKTVLGVGTYHDHARNKLKSNVYTFSHFGNLRIDKNLIKWSLSYQKEEISDKIKEWEMRDSAGYSLPSNGKEVNLYSNLKSDNRIIPSRISGYIQDTYTFETGEGLFILNAGLRGSYWSFNKEFIVSPRGALAFVPAGIENLSFRIAGGVYYQAPFYKEFQHVLSINGNNIVELNKDIKSQKSVHLVLGSDYYLGGDKEQNIPPYKLSGEIYYKKLSDLVPYTVNNVKIRYSGENESKGYSMGVDVKLYGEFIPGADSWVSISLMKAQQKIEGVDVPLPTDQRFNLALFYQDYFPGYERLKMSLRGLWSQGLPVSAPHKGYESGYFRTPAYKRIDLGFSWLILGEDFSIRNKNSGLKAFRNIWLGLDVFNLFDMQNTNTYYWVTDVYNQQYAVPNYLTGRQLNVKLLAEF